MLSSGKALAISTCTSFTVPLSLISTNKNHVLTGGFLFLFLVFIRVLENNKTKSDIFSTYSRRIFFSFFPEFSVILSLKDEQPVSSINIWI